MVENQESLEWVSAIFSSSTVLLLGFYISVIKISD